MSRLSLPVTNGRSFGEQMEQSSLKDFEDFYDFESSQGQLHFDVSLL